MKNVRWSWLCGWAALLAITLSGCGRSTENLVHVAGTVSFAGKPIPVGMIIFEPDSSKGNLGPQCHAEIKDGQFDTRLTGSGVAIGPQIVRITGGDGVNPEAFTPLGKLLFEEHTIKMEISAEQPAIKLEVPQQRQATAMP